MPTEPAEPTQVAVPEAPEQTAEPVPEAPSPGGAAAYMLGLQRGIGNQQAARVARAMLDRQPVDAPADAGVPPAAGVPDPNADFETNLKAAEDFAAKGPYTGEVTPGSAGTGGGFEATYDPVAQELLVTMRCAINFKHGIDDSTGTLVPGDPAMAPVITQANALTGADRLRFIAQYKWDVAGSAERTTWMTNLKNSVESTWSGQHEFHLNLSQWEWIGARVRVDVRTHESPKAGNDHIEITTVKMPPTQNLYSFNNAPENNPATGPRTRGFSWTNEGSTNDPHDQTMLLASSDIGGRPDYNVLRSSVMFGINSKDLDQAGKDHLDNWIATFNGKVADPRSVKQKVTLEGHASATGTDEYNMKLAQDRIDTVAQYLRDKGFSDVGGRATLRDRGEKDAHGGEDAQDRRVDLIVGDGNPQVLAAHEFGHAFGLDDEYADTPLYGGSGAAVGDAASHDPQTQAMQDDSGQHLKGAIHEETDSIMSAGNTVRPQHYSTFHAALCEITGQTEWALGPPHAKPTGPPGGP
jgi:outer membrane protein OmpA-like peptidoglycan-associated protein